MNPTAPSYIPQIITGCFTLLGVALGFLLQQWARVREDRAKVRREFNAHKLSIMMETIENNISPKLFELKKFFNQNPEFVSKNKAAAKFYGQWLMHSTTDLAFTGIGYWTKESRERMGKDLVAIVL
jgi:hypothetical protein